MPRGFLVKRQHNRPHYSYRQRHNSDGERSDSSSENETVYTHYGSPDSGYSHSPVSKTFRDAPFYRDISPERLNGLGLLTAGVLSERTSNAHPISLPNTPASSPLSSASSYISYPGSPFHFTAFDRLSVTSPVSHPYQQTATDLRISSLNSPTKRLHESSASKPSRPTKTQKKVKAVRKINFDDTKSSPISGTIIKDESDETKHVVCGDIDSSLNFVEVTPEAKAEIAKIENKIGDYVCQLCKELFEDAFRLAQHKCSRIVHVEYRCPECDKVFNCPANLASHRRWHKPRNTITSKTSQKATAHDRFSGPGSPPKRVKTPDYDINANPHLAAADVMRLTPSPEEIAMTGHTVVPADTSLGQFECQNCGRRFKRQAYLRKHISSHCSGTVDPYPCHLCRKTFKTEGSRTKHLLLHTMAAPINLMTKLEPELYSCKYCSARFSNSPALTRHINKSHPSENRQVLMLQMPQLPVSPVC